MPKFSSTLLFLFAGMAYAVVNNYTMRYGGSLSGIEEIFHDQSLPSRIACDNLPREFQEVDFKSYKKVLWKDVGLPRIGALRTALLFNGSHHSWAVRQCSLQQTAQPPAFRRAADQLIDMIS